MYYAKNASGQYWTGECWGTEEDRALYMYRGNIVKSMKTAVLDEDCNPSTAFDNAPDDIGWGSEDGEIFARVVRL